jgi:hypothetical protein
VTEFDTELAHLVRLCQQEAFKRYGWHKAKQLERDFVQYRGLSEALTKAMQRKNDATG